MRMTLLARLMRFEVGRVRCLGNKHDRERETKQLTDVGGGGEACQHNSKKSFTVLLASHRPQW
jgi:hypothetical protein